MTSTDPPGESAASGLPAATPQLLFPAFGALPASPIATLGGGGGWTGPDRNSDRRRTSLAGLAGRAAKIVFGVAVEVGDPPPTPIPSQFAYGQVGEQ
jgi:hypothetical protein